MNLTPQTSELMQYAVYSLTLVYLANVLLGRIGEWAISAFEGN
jgi:hypothetical protein